MFPPADPLFYDREHRRRADQVTMEIFVRRRLEFPTPSFVRVTSLLEPVFGSTGDYELAGLARENQLFYGLLVQKPLVQLPLAHNVTANDLPMFSTVLRGGEAAACRFLPRCRLNRGIFSSQRIGNGYLFPVDEVRLL